MGPKVILPEVFNELVDGLLHLPGIGRKTAVRLAFYLFNSRDEEVEKLGRILLELKKKLHPCPVCGFITDADMCGICKDENRDRNILCVVENSRDVISIENTGGYKGLYHVLGGVIAPYNRVGPEDLRIDGLIKRVENGNFKEIIIATNPKIEGDMTFYYLVDLLKAFDVKISRLAYGLPVGGDIEYADGITLRKAIENRLTVKIERG